jgi:hypothetical protein
MGFVHAGVDDAYFYHCTTREGGRTEVLLPGSNEVL